MQKSHNFIRDGANYRNFSVFEFAGIRFVAYAKIADELDLEPIEVDEIPQFITHLRIAINSKSQLVWYDIYVLNKDDIRSLCEKYSRVMKRKVRVLGASRILGNWRNGEPVFNVRTLDYYYENESKENIEHYSF